MGTEAIRLRASRERMNSIKKILPEYKQISLADEFKKIPGRLTRLILKCPVSNKINLLYLLLFFISIAEIVLIILGVIFDEIPTV